MKHHNRFHLLSVCAAVLLILSLLFCGMGFSLLADEYTGDELSVELTASDQGDGNFDLELKLTNRADYALHNISYRWKLPDGATANAADVALLVGTLNSGTTHNASLSVYVTADEETTPPQTPSDETPGDELNPPANRTTPWGIILTVVGIVLLAIAAVITALLIYKKKKASSIVSMLAILLCGVTLMGLSSFADAPMQRVTASCTIAGKTVSVEVTYAKQLDVSKGAVKAESGSIALKDSTIYIDSVSELSTVQRAAGDLVNDFKMVTSKAPELKSALSDLGDRAVIVGTLGHSNLIDSLVSAGILDASAISGGTALPTCLN